MAAQPSHTVTPIGQNAAVDELQRQRSQIDQQRSQLSQERERLQNLEQAAQGTLQGLQHSVTATTGQIKASDSALQQATTHLKQLETKLATAEQTFRQKQFSTVARLRFLQRQQVNRGWAVLLQSQNLNEFLDRRRQLRLIYHTDRTILLSLQTDAERLEQQRSQVEQQKNQIALIKQELLAQKSNVEEQLAFQRESVDRLKSDRRALQAAESQLEQDSLAIASMIQQRMGGQGGISLVMRGTGQFMLPCVAEVTSNFGWRMHPILGYQRFHSGMDFGADYGTLIQAVDSGTVIFAGWYGGYGNAVIIDHGNGLTTLYAHTSEFYVVEGQGVQRGQAIAAVGSTGLSTGPHLHFEVRRDGEPVDPIAYL
ncbi:MAG: peptidoglycan DD-metalloendopeptidase family protein [Pantanalinema sp. GBBB05]|nr:peptidoglycan DD-metalloendopeptidase family protein [Pantanalinema sp. GBBB05]